MPDHWEREVCPVVDVEVGNELETSVIDGGLDFSKTPACKKQSATGNRLKKKTSSKAPMEQS